MQQTSYENLCIIRIIIVIITLAVLIIVKLNLKKRNQSKKIIIEI